LYASCEITEIKLSEKIDRVLVTGGAGFIGYRVVNAILAASSNTQVAIIDNLSVGMSMPQARERLLCLKVDIRDSSELEKIVNDFRPSTVVHLAAVHHIPTCEKQRAYSLDVNITGTENVLAVAEKSGTKQFVLASSGAVYDWSDGPLSEDESPLRPMDNYSLAKFTNEKQTMFWAARNDAKLRIARIFNTIGHDDPNAHLIPDIVSQIPMNAKNATIHLGNLTPRRDYIHADDTARGIATLAMDKDGEQIDIFNIATGHDVSVGELVKMLGVVMGVNIEVVADETRKRKVDRPSQLGNSEKLRARLGFLPQKSLRIALRDIVQISGRRIAAE
jgi:UDP-glucose 4-epimerase